MPQPAQFAEFLQPRHKTSDETNGGCCASMDATSPLERWGEATNVLGVARHPSGGGNAFQSEVAAIVFGNVFSRLRDHSVVDGWLQGQSTTVGEGQASGRC